MKRVLTVLLAVVVFASFGTVAKAAVEFSELGDTGTSVTQIQQKLHDLGFLYCEPTGYFGQGTQSAVINFQKTSGLTADGKVGNATIKALFGSSTPSTTSSSANTQKASTAPTTSTSGDALRYGDNNKYVTELQQKLHDLGFLVANPTGYYGTSTRAAVRNYQKTMGLTADGIAGTDTRKALLGSKYTSLNSSNTAPAAKPAATTTSSSSSNASKASNSADDGEIAPGDRGSLVSTVQTKLKKLGYYTYSKISEFYGPITQAAVRQFQAANGLAVDGVVGPKTLAKLNSSSAISKSKAATKTTATKTSSTKTTKTVSVLGASSSSSAKIEAMISYAKSKLGCRYVWGATGSSTFDCSGLVLCSLRSVGVSSPRTSSSMSQVSSWTKISKSNLQRGDLVFFRSSRTSSVTHVGIYLGDGQFIHASSGKGRVTISSINSSYYSRYFKWGRRVF